MIPVKQAQMASWGSRYSFTPTGAQSPIASVGTLIIRDGVQLDGLTALLPD